MAVITLQIAEGDELEVHNDGQWIRSELPEPDPNWRGTDSNGHEHYYADGTDRYPTLREVSGEPFWCDTCEEEEVPTWLECPICGEQVAPGTRTPEPIWLAGPQSFFLNGEPITKERAEEIASEMHRARDEAMKLQGRPTVGSRVRLDGTFVTVVPTADSEPESRVTVMRHGSGDMATVDLDQLRREQ